MTAAEFYAILPIAILGMGSMALLLLGAFAPGISRRSLTLTGAAIAFAAGLTSLSYTPTVAEAGGMIGTSGIDKLFGGISGLSAFITLMLSAGYTERRQLGREEFPSLALFAAFGMSILASATSLLGVFLGIECMSLALYIMLASNREDPLSGEAGLKYLVVGAVSTAFLAFGLGLIYAATGDLSINGSMMAAVSGGHSPVLLAGLGFLLVGFGFKTSLFPFHLWAPDVYEGGPAPVVAFLSTGSKAAVFAALMNLSLTQGNVAWGPLMPALWVIAAATMVFGNLAALTQRNIKRLLAYSSIAQMGYVLTAVIAAPHAGATAAVFYLVSYVLMDLGAFGVVAAFSGRDSDVADIDSLRGQGFVHPFRSAVLTVCLLSLAGLPPTAGFIGKFWVFYAAIKAGYVYLAVLGIVTAIISVYYYLKVVVALYFSPPAPGVLMPRYDPEGRLALAILALAIIFLGVFPNGLINAIRGLSAYFSM